MRATFALPQSFIAVALVLSCVTSAHAIPVTQGTASPGGIPGSNLELWLDANTGAESAAGVDAMSGQSVQFWRDRAGANDASQGTLANRPVYGTGGPNGSAVLTFGGSGGTANPKHWLNASVSTTTNNFSMFAVALRNGTHQIEAQSTSGTGGTSGQYYLFGPSNRGTEAGAGVSVGINGISVYEHGNSYMPSLATWSPGGNPVTGYNLLGVEYTTKQPRIYLDGQLVHTGLTSSKSLVYAPHEIGGNSNYGGLDGNVAEVIIFNRALAGSEKVLVNNYLSSKYNLPTASDRYQGDLASNGSYHLDVFGIGQVSAGDRVLDGESAGLKMSAISLSNNQWVLAGHNAVENGVAELTTEGKLAGQRWERVWYVDNNNNDVDLALEFNFDDAGLTSHFDAGDTFKLLYAPTSDLAWQVANVQGVLNGTSIVFNVDGLLNGYYTLGLNVSLVPEPSSLVLITGLGLAAMVRRRRRPRLARATEGFVGRS